MKSERPHRTIPTLVAVFALMLTAGTATAKCLRYKVVASGVPVHFLYAKKGGKSPEEAAQAAWEHLVAWQYGREFANWKNTSQGRIDCWLPNRSYTQCKAVAIPCDGKTDD